MKQKTLAQRGALRRVSKDVGFAVDTLETNPNTAFRQAYLAAHHNISPAMAGVISELAFPTLDTWRATR